MLTVMEVHTEEGCVIETQVEEIIMGENSDMRDFITKV